LRKVYFISDIEKIVEEDEKEKERLQEILKAYKFM